MFTLEAPNTTGSTNNFCSVELNLTLTAVEAPIPMVSLGFIFKDITSLFNIPWEVDIEVDIDTVETTFSILPVTWV